SERVPSGELFAQTVSAWDAALLDGETQKWLAQRALELDAPPGAVDRAIRDVAQAVTDELARIADASSLAAPASRGPVGDALARRGAAAGAGAPRGAGGGGGGRRAGGGGGGAGARRRGGGGGGGGRPGPRGARPAPARRGGGARGPARRARRAGSVVFR